MIKCNLGDTASQNIFNAVDRLYQNIEDFDVFDTIIKELRVLYKTYPNCFSENIITQICSYKKASYILRNMKRETYNFDYKKTKETDYYRPNQHFGKPKYVISKDGTISRFSSLHNSVK